MADRYFLDSPPLNDQAVVSGSEAHHLIHVMRVRPGHEIVLFDGSGTEFQARVEKATRSEVHCQLLSREEVNRESDVAIVLGVALPKGDRQHWLIEKAVELGVARLVPLETERGVAQPVEKALVRLRRSVIEASKQCGRNRLMEIAEPQPWPHYVENDFLGQRWIAHPGGARVANMLLSIRESEQLEEIRFAVGPEGGFTPNEVELALGRGWKAVDLGPRILRIETAAVALAALASIVK
jgi:16S rRNA (uracil1498-N3)-methyltransferase